MLGIDCALPEILLRVRFGLELAKKLCMSACTVMYAIVKRRKTTVEVRVKDLVAAGKEMVEFLTHFVHDVREIEQAFTSCFASAWWARCTST